MKTKTKHCLTDRTALLPVLTKKSLYLLARAMVLLLMVHLSVVAQEMVFPRGAVVNVTQAPWNADNTGTKDVTSIINDAFQWARDRSLVLYFPDGTYLVSNSIQLKKQPPWPRQTNQDDQMLAGQRIWGQSKENTIIKLKNNASGFGNPSNTKYVIDYMPTIPRANSNMSSYIENLTVHTGSGNSGASGVRFHANNTGCVRNLKVVSGDGAGVYGVDLSRRTNGPGYAKWITVEGFQIGIMLGHEDETGSFHHYCLDQCEVSGQSEFGIRSINIPLTILKLKSNNDVPAVDLEGHTQCLLLEGNLRGGSSNKAAIESVSKAFYFTRDVTYTGYRNLINYGGNFRGSSGGEHTSHAGVRTGELDGSSSIAIPLLEPPMIPEGNPSSWANVESFGAKGGDTNSDDTDAIQAAMNSGASTVFFPVGVYRLGKTIVIPAHVKRVNFMFSRLTSKGSAINNNSEFAFEIRGTDPIVIERLGNAPATASILPKPGNPRWTWFNHASKRTVYFKDMHGQGVAAFYKNSVTGGRVFVEVMKNLDGTGDDCWVVKGQELWGRQFNVEDGLAIDASNSIIWLSGGKQENGGRKFEFKDGTVAELYGHTLLGNFGSSNNPIIVNQNSHVVAFLTEYARDGSFGKVVEETADGSTKDLRKNAFPQVDLGKGSTFVHYYAGYDKSFVNNKLKDIGGGPTPPTPAEQTAYQGPHTIPGKLEAEHYDNGGEGVAFRDTDAGNRGGCGRNDNVDLQTASDDGGGCNVGWTRGGEWLEYTMAQVSAGTYNLNVRLASGSSSPGTLTVKLAGRTLGTIDVANTGGWQNYVTRTLSNIRLAQGSNQVLRLEITQGSFNINWMRFTKVATPQPVGGTLLPIADAYVRGNGEQDGSGEALLIKQGGSSSYERVSYLKFDLSGYTSAQISSATLRLYCTELQDNSTRTTVAVHGSADNWTEQGITWQNKPALGNRLGSSVVDRVGRYYAFNVSQYVQGQAAGDKTVSLALVDGGAVNKALFFGSRESGNPPQLVITTTNARQGSGDKAALALEEAAVQVYPNPATGIVTVSGAATGQPVQLINLQGQVLLDKQLQGETQLDVSALPKGLYLVRIYTAAGNIEVKKLQLE